MNCWKIDIWFLWLICTLFVALPHASPGSVQEIRDEFSDGPLQQRPDRMRKLIRLKLDGKSLSIRKDWKQAVSDEEQDKQFEADVQKMVERGLDEANARLLMARKMKNNIEHDPFGNAFMQLAIGSTGRSSSGNNTVYRFSGRDIWATAETRIDSMRIAFAERTFLEREWFILQQEDGRLTFRYSGENFLVLLKQKSDGSIRIIRVRDDETEAFSGPSFVSLQEQHPELINDWLFPLFDHLGFTLPLTTDNPAIRRAVIQKLEAAEQLDPNAFDRLIAELDSEEFEARDAASEKLMAHRALWSGAIARVLESNELSAEVRTRLIRILKQTRVESQEEEIIREQNLVNSPEYLVKLITDDDRETNKLVISQLEKITGESLSDPDAWKQRFNNRDK